MQNSNPALLLRQHLNIHEQATNAVQQYIKDIIESETFLTRTNSIKQLVFEELPSNSL